MSIINMSVEVWWKCNQCDAMNNYLERKNCEVCGAPLGKEDETKCIYKVADTLYHGAVSADDFVEAAGYFLKIPHYEDSVQKCQTCRQKAQKIQSDEKAYAEATQHWGTACNLEKAGSLADAEREYALAEQQFREIISFKEARQNRMKCLQAERDVHQRRIYIQAEDAFSKASSISDYENAARLFSEIAEFSDAKIKRDQCFKCVKEIQIEQQYQEILNSKTLAEKETDINKKASRYKGMISVFDKNILSEKAKILLEQCKSSHNECLKQIEEHRMQELLNKASAQFEEADKVSDNASRAVALSKVLDEYKDYAENKKFAQLLCDCRDKLKMANDSIAYDAAVVLMNKADKECEYTDAAAAFSVLSGFKDSDEKKAMCVSRAEECKKRESYHKAIESINRSKEITLFNWRKYR